MRKFFSWTGRGFIIVIVMAYAFGVYWATGQNRQVDEMEIYAPADNAPGMIIEVAGRNMHVLIKGKLEADATGAPLVLLHGFSAAGHATWLPWANRLAARRTVVLIDMLNFGHSERLTEPNADLTHQGQAALVNALLESLGLQQVDLVGWSMGGTIAAQFALDFPDRVRALAFVAGHVYGANRFNPFEMMGRLPLGVGRAMSWNSVGGSPNGFVARTCESKGEQCNWLPLLRIDNTLDGLRAISATEQISRLPDDVPLIDKPTLVIAGETDNIVPRADSDLLAETLNAEMFVAEGAGHWPGEQDPALLAQVILNFFAANAPPVERPSPRVKPGHSLTGEY